MSKTTSRLTGAEGGVGTSEWGDHGVRACSGGLDDVHVPPVSTERRARGGAQDMNVW